MMRMANARVAWSARATSRLTVAIRGRKLFYGDTPGDSLDLSGYLLLPGLVNAHDHLEFNLFPRLGRRLYSNATEWAHDIHQPEQSPVREHLSVPKRDRLTWGGLRNLLSGVTTVAHHNPYDEDAFGDDFPVRVVRRFGWAHSLAFSPDALERYRETPGEAPFLIHAGEGTDAAARAELRALDRLGILGSRTVLVHAIAFQGEALTTIARRGASIVWCPSSNLLTYGATLPYDRTRAAVRLALGTDSAISAAGDMIDELRLARSQSGVTPDALYAMVTTDAASILRLREGEGGLANGAVADLIAVADEGQQPAEALLQFAPEMVIVGGRLKLVSKSLLSRIDPAVIRGFQPIALEGRGEFYVPFDIARLLRDTRAALGEAFRLAGKPVWQ